MDLVAATTRYVLLPPYMWWTGSRMLRHYRRFRATQHLSSDEVKANQWAALQRALRFAQERTPFYRRRFRDLGVTAADIRSFEDFSRLPVLTKAQLREHVAELTAEGADLSRMERKRTGGSSGVPVHVYWDKDTFDARNALTLRHDEWAGFGIASKRGALWGDVEPRTTLRRKLTGRLYERTIFLDTLKMDEAGMLRFARDLRRTRTRLLFGHGHSLYFFARFLADRGMDDLRLDGIISSSEMLPPEERRVVEQVFGKLVFDRYGCEEVSLIASECEAHAGMHVAAESVHMEVIGGSATEPGKVVVTDLLSRGTALLRYEIGDLATTMAGPCPCGRGLPRIGSVTGRTSDFLYSPEGKRISGISLLDTVTIHIPGFKQVQVVQDRLDELTFNVVTDEKVSEKSYEMLAAGVAKYFGPAMRHKVSVVDAVPLVGRGKFQFSICRLRPDDLPGRQEAS